jgi:hypothetical protein
MAQRLEDLLDIVGSQALETPVAGMGMNLTGTPNINYLQNLANLAQQQQGPVLGPDDFGSYTIPMSDPTYRSGFDYARSIAGGIPMSQVIAPGVSYSPEQPMGYTQEQLNIPRDVEKLTPPAITYETPDDPTYFGTGIGGVNIPVDRDMKMPPLRDIFGGRRDTSSLENLMNIGKLFSGGIDQDAIDRIVQERIAESMPTFEQPDLSQFIRREDIPTLIPEVPTGRDFSIDREALRKELMEDIRGSINIPDISGLARLEDIPQIPTREDFLSIAREGIDIPMPQQPDISKFVTQEDINRAIAGIDIPTYQAPDLSGISTRLSDLEKGLLTLQEPTGGRFSVQQQRPIGLFA